jgi:DNA-binding NarL/FixJ family response regulator
MISTTETRPERLNPRQTDVLRSVCKGFRNAEIGRQLGISERTVKWYVSQLLLRFDVTNRTELAGFVTDKDFETFSKPKGIPTVP